MIAVDCGFLVALADPRDSWHQRAVAQLGTQVEGWITTWPVLTETSYMLQKYLDPAFSAALMDDVGVGFIDVWTWGAQEQLRLAPLMRKYLALPMDLADASLVLLAEHLGHGRILTTDQRDFGAYRWKSRKPFVNLMEAAP
jgi:uncharacterized protein